MRKERVPPSPPTFSTHTPVSSPNDKGGSTEYGIIPLEPGTISPSLSSPPSPTPSQDHTSLIEFAVPSRSIKLDAPLNSCSSTISIGYEANGYDDQDWNVAGRRTRSTLPSSAVTSNSWNALFESSALSLSPSNSKVGSNNRQTPPPLPNAGEGGLAKLTIQDGSESLENNQIQEDINISGRSLLVMKNIPPRGLANYGNTCFFNAIVQSLIHCPPLANLFTMLRPRLSFVSIEDAPFLRAMSDIFISYEEVNSSFEETSTNGIASRSGRTAFLTPRSLYDCLKCNSMSSDTFQGAQEDAQEFLTFLLDQMHEELLACRKPLGWRFHSDLEDRDSTSSGEWLEVGPKQRIIRARSMELSASPISFLFFGRYRSLLHRPRSKDSITTEPFHCISVDVPSTGEEKTSLEDSLLRLVTTEQLDGGMTKQISIESEPPVLIIQLKRFVYNPRTHRVEKIGKFVSYPETLSLTTPVLYREAVHTPKYRLFSVIYHHGKGADGGHYTCHVRQSLNPNEPWLLFDDAVFRLDFLEGVLAPKGPHQTAYLLIYVKLKERKPLK